MIATNVVDLALACYRTPLAYQDQLSRAAPLPEGIDRLLWLANGSPEALDAAARQTGAQPRELRDAARFCIQQWCLVRGADPHRVLGVEPGTPLEQTREHYRLLMRLFHPDRAAGRETWTDHYASRINEAWTALSRTPDRARPDHPFDPRHVPVRDTLRPAAERASERPKPFSGRPPPGRRRRWLSRLALGGLMLTVMMALGEYCLDRFSVSRSGFQPIRAVDSTPPSGAVPESAAAPMADPGAFGALLAAPDWRALEQREPLAQQPVPRVREARPAWEDHRQQPIAAEEALPEKMRAEQARFEEQVKIEQARNEQAQAERLAVEQQRWARLQAEQARVEQAKTERELAERRLRAEQTRAERLAETQQVERQRLEKLKIEQARAERLAAEEHPLTSGELESLMSRYTGAYQQGDLGGVMALFTASARRRIQQDYTALFATHHIHGLWLRDLRWLYRGQSASGSGHYELQVRRRDNGELHQLAGSIRFTAQKRGHQVLIEAIEFDWPGK